MISNQTIKQSIESLHGITKIDFAVFDPSGSPVGRTWDEALQMTDHVRQFATSPADSQEVKGCHFFKISNENQLEYILLAKGAGEDVHTMGRVAVSQIAALMTAYEDRYDRNSFIQNLLLDNMLLVDIYNRAKKLHIENEVRRLVYIVETAQEKDTTAMEIMRGLFLGSGRDFITEVDEHSIILVQELEEEQSYDYGKYTAEMICDMMNTEAMANVRVAFGTIVHDLQQVSRSYKEARMALDVGRIFYTEKHIHAYSSLGIGRLIYQLPISLCEMFMNEVFTLEKPESFDEETLTTINKFFENNLNVSETARQLFVHRNTLVYRLEKLQKSTGLDIRSFDDALTFKIALMVVGYMRYMNNREN